ncbi:electron transport complex subunit RsxA [Psittacicella gerlachiana]|uniref:Ion-translocating oxidoreductase complex subunit A n=1 Tax=Psittacicella gerlachiana TaxID=2028574 RepID=A0A3A1YHS8_9GAMM|nr:electron transport complex subunit RsxA [Psittacicella gerlachiana]RIY37161.1 electron transport complex subunit RsxA [Psittacicella gerlachiana]
MLTIIYAIIAAVFINNFVLVKFLGLCPVVGTSQKLDTAVGMGMATTFVLTLASLTSYLIAAYILEPLNATYLSTIAFIFIIAVIVQITEMVLKKVSPGLYKVLGIFLPLITTNCAVLGVAILNLNSNYSFLQSVLNGFFSALGFTLVLVLFASIRERLNSANTPSVFKGVPIALITIGLMAIAFMGFTGLGK